MNLYILSNHLWLLEDDLVALLEWNITLGVAQNFWVPDFSIQEFIDGEESILFSRYLWMTISDLQDFREILWREKTIGYLLALLEIKK